MQNKSKPISSIGALELFRDWVCLGLIGIEIGFNWV